MLIAKESANLMLLCKKVLESKFLRIGWSGHGIGKFEMLTNWVKKWNRFVNVNNTLLNFTLLVGYSQAKSDKNPTSHVWTGLATAPNFTPAKAVSGFLVITTPDSYKLNVAKILEHISYSSYVLIRKKRPIQRQKLE